MNTLEYLVKLELDKGGYVYNQNMLRAAAVYIEIHNEHCDIDGLDDEWWTPVDWVHCTKEDYPEKLVTKNCLYERILNYFIHQRKQCLDETGCLPCYEDFWESMQSDDYMDAVGEYADLVDMTDIINFLLTYYEKEGRVWNI